MTRVVTELVIDARGAEQGARAYERAMDSAKTAAERMAAAEEKAQAGMERQSTALVGGGRLLEERSRAFDRLRAKIDPHFALEQRLTKARMDADRAVRTGMATQAEAGRVLDAYRAKQAQLLGLTARVAAANDNTAGSFASLAGSVRTGIAAVAGAIALIGGGQAIAGIAKAGLEMESLQRGFAAAAGSAEQGAREFTFIRDTSDRLGLSLGDTAKQYQSFLAASRGTALQGKDTRDIFVAVSSAMGALGKGGEETGRALTAVQQMMSKGKVSAEEMTGQLGEALPGALGMSAKAMGMTQAALLKLMGDGKLMASDLLPKLAKELQATYGDAAAKAANGLQANLNRLSTAWLDTRDTIARNGLNDALSRAAGDLAGFLKDNEAAAASLGRSLAGTVDNLRSFGAAAVDAFDSARIVLQMVGEFDQATTRPTIDTSGIEGGFASATAGIAAAAQQDINTVIGVFVGGYQMAVAAWNGLPAAFSALGATAANFLISAVEGAVNLTIAGVNKVVDAINSVGSNVPGFTGLEKAATVSFGRIEAASAGAAGKLVDDLAGIGKAAMSRDYLGDAGTAIANRFNELKAASKSAREEQKRAADEAKAGSLADALKNTGQGAKQAAEDLDKAGKAAKAASQEFDALKSAGEAAAKILFPAEMLKKQGEELQTQLAKYRDQLEKVDPRYVTAIEAKIKLNLEGKELETVKDKTDDLAKEMTKAFTGVFDDMFSAGNKGLSGFLDNFTKGFAKIGTRMIEQNLIKPLFEGGGGANGAGPGFNLNSLSRAIEVGSEKGFTAGWEELTKPRATSGASGAASGGFVSTPLGSALTTAGAGAAIGYQSQSPLMGAMGGALAGLATGNPLMAAAGPRCGRGALFGKPAKPKPQQEPVENDRSQRDRAA